MNIRIATTRRERMLGLRRQSSMARNEGLLFPKCRSVQTFGMRFSIDVLYLDGGLRVIDVVHMKPNRLGRPRIRARHVLECSPTGRVKRGMTLDEIRRARRPRGANGPGDILCCPKGWEPVPIV